MPGLNGQNDQKALFQYIIIAIEHLLHFIMLHSNDDVDLKYFKISDCYYG